MTPDTRTTENPEPRTACRHPYIERHRNEQHDLTMWSCGDCARRFYPACEKCVSVGHREGHGEHIEAEAGAMAAEWHRYLHAEGILLPDDGINVDGCGPWHHRVFLGETAPRSTPAEALDVDELGFYDLLNVADAILRKYPPDTIVCSHSVKADRGALTSAAIADLIASCRLRSLESDEAR